MSDDGKRELERAAASASIPAAVRAELRVYLGERRSRVLGPSDHAVVKAARDLDEAVRGEKRSASQPNAPALVLALVEALVEARASSERAGR